MTLQSARRITGLDIRLIPPTSKIGTAVTYAAFDGETEVIRRTESGHSHALSAVVETLYRRMVKRVCDDQHWMCFVCGQRKPLQGDHIRPRSHGRCDQRHNLRSVCADCHRKITDNLIYPTCHPKVLELVEKRGWTWGTDDRNQVRWLPLDIAPTLERPETERGATA
jgi:hypothetical protein